MISFKFATNSCFYSFNNRIDDKENNGRFHENYLIYSIPYLYNMNNTIITRKKKEI